MLAEKQNTGQDFLQKTIDFDNSDVMFQQRSSRPAWNPNVSVLELAYKLKEAERSVFGHSQTKSAHSAPLNSVHQASLAHPHAMPVTLDARHYVNPLTATTIKTEPVDNVELNGSKTDAYDRPILSGLLYKGPQPHVSMPGLLPLLSGSSKHTSSAVLPPGLNGSDVPVSVDRTSGGLGDAFVGCGTTAGHIDPMLQYVLSESPQTGAELPQQQQRHQCQQCTYSTNNLHHMRRHCASVHTEMKPYQCYVCNQEFTRSEKVREHFVSFHPDVAYDAKLVRKFSVATGDGAKDLAPPVDIKARIRALFQDIEGTDMEFETDRDRPFGCLRCSYATRDLWHLRRHVFDVHAARKQHNCRICRYATNRSMRLQAHMRGHGELFCEYCDDFSTLQPDYFSLHDKLCSALAAVSAAGFRCRACGNDCGERALLRSHSVEQHGVELAACDECPFYAYTSDEFLAHVEVHEAISRTCGLCGLTFGTRVERDQHDILAHLISRQSADGRDLACGICGEVSNPRGNLEFAIAHVRRHVPEIVTCKDPGCNFKAILPQSLEMHVRYYHTTNPPATTDPLPPRPKVDSVTLSNMPVAAPREKAVEKTLLQMSRSSSSASLPSTSLVGTFACSICGPKRTPFKYWRSYEKHMAQHGLSASAGR